MSSSNKRGIGVWPLVIVCLLLAAGVLYRPQARGDHATQPLPPLLADGWLNGDGPPEVEGKIVVLDAWFTTCPPCRASLPTLAAIHQDYGGDPRVEFVGLTFEPEEMRSQIEKVIAEVKGFNWPVGYGAGETLQTLGVQGYPTVIVFDQNGMSVWSGHNVRQLRNELERLL